MSECIEWEGLRNSKGYGRAWYEGKMWLAHRAAWAKVHGPIPEGMCILHRCDNPPCVNSDHLFVGTQADNIRDAQRKGRMPTPRHGTPSMYNWGKCRCKECGEARRDYKRELRKKAQ